MNTSEFTEQVATPVEGQAEDQQVKPKKVRKPRAPKPEGEGNGKTKGFREGTKFPLNATITIVSAENPKLVGSNAAADWLLYRDGMTVHEALLAGISRADIMYNASHDFIKVSGYDAPPPKKRPKKEKVVEQSAEQPTEQPAA